MTFKCFFKKLYNIAVNLGYTGLCAPKNFNELWCLVDNLTLLSEGLVVTLTSTDDDLVIGPWPEDRLLIFIADAGNSDTFSYQEEGEAAGPVPAGDLLTDTIDAGNTLTFIAPGAGTRAGRYFLITIPA